MTPAFDLKKQFSVPKNFYLLGLMDTAIALEWIQGRSFCLPAFDEAFMSSNLNLEFDLVEKR